VARAYVRLTAPAVDDLRALTRSDPQIVRRALKKMLLLERDPHAGRPLLGSLVGWRKLTVGDRDWRIVWRVTTDEEGVTVVEIAEVWAVGARADAEVYAEMERRVAAVAETPTTTALNEVIALLGRAARGAVAAVEPAAESVPEWLARRLRDQAGMSDAAIAALTPEKAMEAWEAHITRER